MKKFLLFLMIVFALGVNAWALPDRIASSEYTVPTQIKSGPGDIYSVHVNYVGVTAGNKIQLIDGTTSSATVRYTCVASATSGTCNALLTVAMYFGTAILYTESKSGGTFTTDIQYF